MPKICVQWPFFGPYHVARLQAATELFAREEIAVTGLETSRHSAVNPWQAPDDRDHLEIHTAVPAATLSSVPANQVRRRIRESLDLIDPDVVAVTAYSMADAQASLLWCGRNRRRAIVMADSTEDDAPRIAWREAIKRTIVSRFSSAVAAGSLHRDYLIKLGMPADRITIGYDVVDNAYFSAEAEIHRAGRTRPWLPGLSDARPYFLASSRFIPRKNIGTIIRAYHRYRKQTDEPWRLVLLGDGPERPAMEVLVSSLGTPAVCFAGFQQLDALPAYYAHAGAFVHAAESEMWGLVINEAMASGLPVIVSKTTGCVPELVRDGLNGFVFEPNADPELCSHMVTIAGDAALRERMGASSREIIAAWSPERFARALLDAYRIAVESPLPPLHRRAAASIVLRSLARISRRFDSFTSVDY